MDLFICATTLHLAITNRIVELENLEGKFDLLFVGNPDIKRKKVYLDRLTQKAHNVIYFNQHIQLKNRYSFTISKASKKLAKSLTPCYNRVLLANTYNKFYGFLLSFLHFNKLNTFDDGIDSINPKSMFYSQKSELWIKKTIQKLYGRKYWQNDLITLSKKHYTLYPNASNINKNLTPISLIDHSRLPTKKPKKTLNILIGSPYRDICSRHNRNEKKLALIKALQFIINKYSISLYFPHPRDEDEYFQNCQSINPNRMSEDIILDLYQEGYAINLFGFAGSVQYNLADIPYIKNYALQSSLVSESINNAANLQPSYFTFLSLDETN